MCFVCLPMACEAPNAPAPPDRLDPSLLMLQHPSYTNLPVSWSLPSTSHGRTSALALTLSSGEKALPEIRAWATPCSASVLSAASPQKSPPWLSCQCPVVFLYRVPPLYSLHDTSLFCVRSCTGAAVPRCVHTRRGHQSLGDHSSNTDCLELTE